MSHRQQQQHHRRMVHEAFGQDAGQVPTSSYGGGGGGGGRTTSVGHGLSNSGISNTNSNDLTQDNYATTGHRSGEHQLIYKPSLLRSSGQGVWWECRGSSTMTGSLIIWNEQREQRWTMKLILAALIRWIPGN